MKSGVYKQAEKRGRRLSLLEASIPRREFLIGGGIALSGLFGCATAITYQGKLVDGRIPLSRSDLEQLGGIENPVVVIVPELSAPVILIPVGGNDFRAVSAECTHLGCYVRPSKNSLQCPCHGSTFDLNGEVLRGPAQSALTTYQVEVKENQIEIIF